MYPLKFLTVDFRMWTPPKSGKNGCAHGTTAAHKVGRTVRRLFLYSFFALQTLVTCIFFAIHVSMDAVFMVSCRRGGVAAGGLPGFLGIGPDVQALLRLFGLV
jgi:hypothetical protein